MHKMATNWRTRSIESTRQQWDDYLLDCDPATAVTHLEKLKEVPVIGTQEYKRTVDRLYKSMISNTGGEADAQYTNVFWTTVKKAAANLGISNETVKQDTIAYLRKLVKKVREEDEDDMVTNRTAARETVDLIEYTYADESKQFWTTLKKLAQKVAVIPLDDDRCPSAIEALRICLSDTVLRRVKDSGDSGGLQVTTADILGAIRLINTDDGEFNWKYGYYTSSPDYTTLRHGGLKPWG